MAEIARRIVLASRPVGEPKPSDFRLEEFPVPQAGPGQLLLRTKWLSLDPYMRGRMSDAPSYAKPVGVGEVMEGGTVSEVAASNNDKFAKGDIVLGHTGWQTHALSNGAGLRKLDPRVAPVSTAVGSAVGQIAKIKGARAVGIAGGADKCSYVTGELGFDACVDYRAGDFPERLNAACPKGADVYFENVGGPVFDAVLPLFNPFARIPVCGLIAQYNATELPPGPNRLPVLMRNVLTKRLTIRGFIVTDFAAKFPEFIRDMPQWIKEGRIKYREDIAEGLENAPQAFMGLLKGKNFGKQLVRVAE